jgi:hypothetical protein
MKRLKWWFLLVGAFYALLGVINMYAVLVDPAYFSSNIPFDWDSNAIQAFVDGWSPFAFEVVGIGTFCLWASRKPQKYVGAVWLLVWLELLHGVFDDIYLIARGYSAASYSAFIVVHFIIILTGIWAARSVSAETQSTYRPATTD